MKAVYATVAIATAAAIAAGVVGCGTKNAEKAAPASGKLSTPLTAPFLFPPPINEGTLVPRPVSRLRPGAPIMVGDNATTLCLAGFYIDYPDRNHGGRQLPAFLTAAQCAQGNTRAQVSVMKDPAAEQNPQRTQIGELVYVTAGDTNPSVTGAPWTMPISPLAVYSFGQPSWPLPVDVLVNNKAQTAAIVQAARPAEQRKATAEWTDTFGAIVTGHVLDPGSTPELRNIPTNVQRVVIAADDQANPIYPQLLGSPVTVELDGVTSDLGIVVGIDDARHWVVVDLIGPFLAAQGAHLLTTN